MTVLPRVGERFGRYRIDSVIGRGGMGMVFGATDLNVGRSVALKVVSAALGDSTGFRQRFAREASVLARLDSPHVIRIFDYGVEADCPYIATQYVAGGDLGGLLRARGAMPPWLALAVCAQVADALHDAHRAGVVHRDVKPGNVLLRDADVSEPHAYLCDFGIARTTGEGLTAPGAVAGTWSYLSPECGRGAPGTPSSDIYALGCLLWVTLTGSPPYRGSDIEIAVAHQRSPIPQLAPVDPAAEQINEILRVSMAKEPEQRYPDADRMRLALQAAAAERPTTITPLPGLAPPLAGSPAAPGTPGMSGGSSGSLPPISYGSLSPASRPGGVRRPRPLLITAAAAVGVLVIAGAIVGVSRLGGSDAQPAASPTDGPSISGTASTTGSPSGLVTGDLDGDGRGDAFVRLARSVKRDGETTTVYDDTTWTSTGTAFGTPSVKQVVPSKLGKTRTRTFHADFDGDGRVDDLGVSLNVDRPGRYTLSGTFSSGEQATGEWTIPAKSTPFITAADVDGDGDADLLLRLYYGYHHSPTRILVSRDDDGRFTQPRGVGVFEGDSPSDTDFVVGDFDGDGRADLAEVHETGNTKAYDQRYRLTLRSSTPTGSGIGVAYPAGQHVDYVSPCCSDLPLAADLDGDGTDEVVLVNTSDAGTISEVDVDAGRPSAPRRIGAFTGANSDHALLPEAEVSDVDGDGRDDIVFVSLSNDAHAALRVALSSGTSVTVRKWASWDARFVGASGSGYFDVGDNPL